MASSVETPITGMPAPKARPLAAATPMRMPVKDPGPTATAMASQAARLRSAFFSIPSTMGMRVRLWVRPLHWKAEAKSAPSSVTAAEQAFAEVSMERILTASRLPQW